MASLVDHDRQMRRCGFLVHPKGAYHHSEEKSVLINTDLKETRHIRKVTLKNLITSLAVISK